MNESANIFIDFLKVLGVPHTEGYSRERFESMPFKSLFGMQKLLGEYHVAAEGYALDSTRRILRLPTPFIARTAGGLIIVTKVSEKDDTASYISQGHEESMTASELVGTVLPEVFVAFPEPDAKEPDYGAHVRSLFMARAKKWILLLSAFLLTAYAFASGALYRNVAAWFILLFNVGGLYVSTLLLQKSLKIHNPVADHVCKVLQEGGCDHVLETKASTFFGIFSWSEVGCAYFSVSLLCLLMFPQWTSCLAVVNLCCLPFSFWSVWYQRFRARAWCTLCLTVQATLWALFACYLLGGYLKHIFPLHIQLAVLAICYLAVLLAINRLSPHLSQSEPQ